MVFSSADLLKIGSPPEKYPEKIRRDSAKLGEVSAWGGVVDEGTTSLQR